MFLAQIVGYNESVKSRQDSRKLAVPDILLESFYFFRMLGRLSKILAVR